MNKLLIVGTVAFDARNSFGKTDKILGGNVHWFVRFFFNLQSAIVSVVGDDFPQEYLDLLTERNIDISGLEVVKGKTLGAVVTITT
jgi:sugar/nucleoside kinase (ribokinase family)